MDTFSVLDGLKPWKSWQSDKVKPMSYGIVGIHVYKYMYTYIEICIYIYILSTLRNTTDFKPLDNIKTKSGTYSRFLRCLLRHSVESELYVRPSARLWHWKRRGSPVMMMMKFPAFTIRCTAVCPVCLWGKYMFFDTSKLPSTQRIKHHRSVVCCGMFAFCL